MKRTRGIGPTGASLVFVVFLGLISCSPAASGPSQPVPPSAPAGPGGAALPGAGGPRSFRQTTIVVKVQKAVEGVLTAERLTGASVQSVTQSQVAAMASGVVSAVHHRTGEWVKEGQTVVQLDDTQAGISLKIAETNLENAKINLAVGQDTNSQSSPKLSLQLEAAQSNLAAAMRNHSSAAALFELGGISASDLDSAKGQLQQAQANLESAKIALEQNKNADTQNLAQLKNNLSLVSLQRDQAQLNFQNTRVKAPFAGQIAAVNVNPGMFVSQNTSVFVLVSADTEVVFNIPPVDAPQFSKGTKVVFQVREKSYPLTVREAPGAPINGVVPITAVWKGSENLPIGTVGTVKYQLTLATGILIPTNALQIQESNHYVFLLENGKARMSRVTLLDEASPLAAVSGITAGSQVVLSPPPGLLDGASLKPVEQTDAAAPSPSEARPEGALSPEKTPREPGSGSAGGERSRRRSSP